ncbi:MAG: hypothetical protein JW941_05070 [Candidatus Coatesbacteria bacterium]|nr:hypothetical protein [Candidatus Coatesbacteria bacterium]
MYVAVIYSKGPNWREEGPKGEHISPHIAHQHRLFDEDILLMGGPFTDGGGGGLAILDVESLDEAQGIVGNDPAVKAGFYEVVFHPWRISLNALNREE